MSGVVDNRVLEIPHKIRVIRRGLAGHKPIEAIERLLFFIRNYPTNAELLKTSRVNASRGRICWEDFHAVTKSRSG